MKSKFLHLTPILNRMFSIYFILSLLPTANSAIYKWIDDQGNTHYSDEQPENEQLKIKKIVIKTNRSSQNDIYKDDEELSQMTIKDNTTDLEKNLTSTKPESDVDESKQKLENIDKAKRQRCEQARKEFAVLSKAIPVYLDDTEQYRLNWAGDTYTGKRSYLDDEDRKTARNKAKETIAEYCSNPSDEKAQTIARKKWARSEYCLLNQAILQDLQRADIKASARQLSKQQALTDKYCNDEDITFSINEPELEISPR